MDSLFIADGHHRSAAALRVKKELSKKNPNHIGDESYNYFLAVAFPHSEMTILDYNRIIKGLNGHTTDTLLSNIEKKFSLKTIKQVELCLRMVQKYLLIKLS